MPQIEIDGKRYDAEDGSTILQVARKNGVRIPTLCYHPAVKPYGACRLCLVEVVDRRGRPNIVTSCSYPVSDGLVVDTSTETVLRARRGMMELLLARCPENETILALARDMGVEGTRFPKVTEAQRDCILCGLCVQMCANVIGASAISFADRGVNRAVAAPFRDASEDCVGCGVCAAICPVGTIKLRWSDTEVEVSPFKSKVPLRRCVQCGALLTGEPFGEMVDDKLKGKEQKHAAMLCDACKRKNLAVTSAMLSKLAAGRSRL
ncbi:MAG: 2Fe-2S iron-sulfur cluster-binding protein [Candidatus Poribacteria bacterium]